jgi:hypothetical protein
MGFKVWGVTRIGADFAYCLVISGTVVGLSLLERLGGTSCADVRVPVYEVLIENVRRVNDSVTTTVIDGPCFTLGNCDT